MVQSIIGEISIWEQSGREIFTGSITDNVLIGTKQNTGGEKLYVVGNTKIEGDIEITGEINATINANTINISDNNTNDTFYLTFVDDSGNTKTLNCDKTTTPLTYNPNTGIITAVGFTGDGSNLTNLTISNLNGLIPNSKLLNDSITIGTTEIDLGSSNNIISGLITVNSTNFNGTLNGTASVATTLTMTNTSSNVGYYLVFSSSPSTGNNTSYVNANLNYNPSTNTLTGGVFNGTSFSGNANSATTATTASVATTLSLTATTTNVGYYLVFSGSPSTGNSAILVSNTLSYNPSTDVMSCGVVNSNLSGNISTIDATANNSDFLLTCITPTPSTYNQLLYTDITYNPQTNILKVGKIDNCFALTGSGSNLPILFIDHTATGKQFLYNNANFYYNPTLGEFLLQGNTTTQNINCNNLTLTSTDAGSNSDPKLILYRNSASPSINDYIGEIQFKGRNTDPADTIYAKINCVLADASSAGGQSYIETTLLKSGSPILISRQFTTEFQLLNNCGLNVDNYIEAKGHCVIEGDVGIGLAIGSSLTYKLDVYDTTSNHCKSAIRSNDQTLEISSYYQGGVGQYSYLQSRQEGTQTNYEKLSLNPNGGNVGIGLTNPIVELHIQGNSGAITSNGLDGIVQIATGNTQTANKLCFGVVDDDYSYLQAYKNNSGGTAFAFADIILNSGGGNVGIATTTPRKSLDVRGAWPQVVATTTTGNSSVMGEFNGTVLFGGHNFALNAWAFAQFYGGFAPTPSDERVKENIKDADLDKLYNQFRKLRIVSYDYKDGFTGKEHNCMCGCQIGFIAQEVDKIFPKVITKEEMNWGTGTLEDFHLIDKMRLSDYTNATLIKATDKIESLENKVMELEEENTYLKNKIIDLENNLELIMEHLDLI